MGFLPSFSAWQFALAGALCAAAPVIIHLLNRQRYKVVRWAAMPFLREALQRNRKMVQLRDLLVLLLRTAAVLFFGLALARPFFSVGAEDFNRSQPLHAILVLDNSLSMGYTQLDGTLLDKAKERAKTFIAELPEGSLVSVIPLCGTQVNISNDPYGYKDKALTAALDALEVVDRSATVRMAETAAKQAQENSPDLAKRIVFFSDQQASNWRDLLSAEQLQALPSMQVVDVAPPEWENTWVADVRVQDGLADIETPTTFIVEVHHHGSAGARKDTLVQLHVAGEIFEKPIVFDGVSGVREVVFEYQFNTVTPTAGQPAFVPVMASVSADNLVADNERQLIVPVVASLPVVFIDQYNDSSEDLVRGRIGETRHLRKLLAPTSRYDDATRQLIKVKHLTIDQVTQTDLENARLVVIAGIRDPGSEETVRLLRDYVRQGGQLVVGAGGDFDARRWNEMAWLSGNGILPAPLSSEPVGSLPDEVTTTLNPLFLSYESLRSHYYFQLGDTSEQQLRDIYSDPMFFKYVEVALDQPVLDSLQAAEVARLDEEYAAAAEVSRLQVQQKSEAANRNEGELPSGEVASANARLNKLRPTWLQFRPPVVYEDLPSDVGARRKQLELEASFTHPQVRARFTSEQGPAYLVERRVGQGNILFVASGLYSQWNTLPKTDTFFMFDRILRSMIRSTLPDRNYAAVERITVPLPTDDRDQEIMLKRPGREDDPEQLDAGFIGTDQLGVTIQKPLARGLYQLTAMKSAQSSDAAMSQVAWEQMLTVNGASSESDLTPLTREAFEERAAQSDVRWVGAAETISLAGAQISGQNSWKYLVLLVLLFLLAELAVLAWPNVKASLEDRRNSAPVAQRP